MGNESQKEFWNGPAGDVWVEAQEIMDRMLAPLSEATLAAAMPKPGERIIDVGCGCGATSLALAESGATVWGLDISQVMLERARSRAEGNDNIVFSVKDAATVDYDPEYDLIFSRFGVMFFSDPKAAFANLRSALLANGRLAFVCWQSPKENLFMSVAAKAASPFMSAPEPQDPRAPGPFAFAEKAWTTEILESAGFSNISITSLTPSLSVGQNLEEAMYFQARVGPLARAIAELDETVQLQAKQAVSEALLEYETDDGIVIPSAAWLVQAFNSS